MRCAVHTVGARAPTDDGGFRRSWVDWHDATTNVQEPARGMGGALTQVRCTREVNPRRRGRENLIDFASRSKKLNGVLSSSMTHAFSAKKKTTVDIEQP